MSRIPDSSCRLCDHPDRAHNDGEIRSCRARFGDTTCCCPDYQAPESEQ